MNIRVLVTYASKCGSTAEIAEKIAANLHEAGLSSDVCPTDQVDNLASYNAIVLGNAVYIGKWRKKAIRFLKINETMLAEKQVWVFSGGPTGEGDPVELLKGWCYPDKLQPIFDRIQPRDIVVFHGAVKMKKLNFIERSMISNVKAPVGDFRDWDAISSWAAEIAVTLTDENELLLNWSNLEDWTNLFKQLRARYCPGGR